MIVKNESKIIKKCLNSVVDYLDYWVISDTGSSDGTQAIIKSFFKEKGIPGELHEDKWKNFGYNRSLYLKYAENKGDFLIILDADEILTVKNKNFKNKIKSKSYNLVKIRGKRVDYRYPMLLSNDIKWKYMGPTHETIKSNEKFNKVLFDDIGVIHIGNGNNKKDKLIRDIALLSRGIKEEPNNARYYFYLAQSYCAFGDYANAIKYHKKRTKMKGENPREIYYSLFMIGKAKLMNGNNFENEVLYDLLRAYNYTKTRLEALYEIVKYYRINKKYLEGYSYGMLGINNSLPKEGLFIHRDIYTHKFMEEMAICAGAIGFHKFAIKLNRKILLLDFLDKNYRARIKRNIQFSMKRVFI